MQITSILNGTWLIVLCHVLMTPFVSVFRTLVYTINKTSILYLECSSRSFAKTCSLTLLALLESFFSIAEHISPVTKKTKRHFTYLHICTFQNIQFNVYEKNQVNILLTLCYHSSKYMIRSH